MLLREDSDMALARELRDGTLTLGEAFTFLSGLYFRGKLAYATRFGAGPAVSRGAAIHSAYVITPTRGLLPPDVPVTAALLREFASVDVDTGNPRYRTALERDAAAIARRIRPGARIILLGSIATGKYVDVLHPVFGSGLQYPSAFVGRGDMSRGGLLLRSSRSGDELEYVQVTPGVRPRGPRAAKLDAV